MVLLKKSFHRNYYYLRGAFSLLRNPVIPPYIIFFVTSKCNAKCGFCDFSLQMAEKDRLKKELKLEEIEKIAKNFGKIIKFSLSGGEPFLRNDLAEVITVFCRYTKPIIVDIPTNGSLPEVIEKQVLKILNKNPDIRLDIQLSIEGPKELHDTIVGVKGYYDRAMESHRRLTMLKRKFSNVGVKANVIYQEKNKAHIAELVEGFENKNYFDRIQITFPHNNKLYKELISKVSYEEFYELARNIHSNCKVRNKKDFHTLFFRAVKISRDDLLLQIMKNKSMGNYCHSGKYGLVLDNIGEVYPCEPNWESVGNLRDSDYKISEILSSDRMKHFRDTHWGENKCHCTWSSAVINIILNNPVYYPGIVKNFFQLLFQI